MSVSNNNADFDELLSAYIDGELTAAERAAVESQLETDPAARELVAEMRSLSGTLKSLPREPLAEDLRSAVLAQIRDKTVVLPPVRISMARRLMWPALAIAAALMLMFVQGDHKREPDHVAKIEVNDGEGRERELAAQPEAAFEAPEEEAPAMDAAVEPAPSAPVVEDRLMVAESDAPSAETAIAVLDEAVDESAARRMTDAMAESDAELEGVVHLTLTDFRSGTERFNRLLLSNGVQLVDGEPPVPAPASTVAPAMEAMSADGPSVAGTMATRSAAPSGGGFGGVATSTADAPATTSAEPEAEMVLVEAPPEQIEQILLGCANDTEAIAEVAVDPTASGMNTVPAKQRLSDYQQYSRAGGKLAVTNVYQVTPQQQTAIAAFNSLPKQMAPTESSDENQQQQGWAARFRADQKPSEAGQLNWQYNQFRDRYYDSQTRQQQAAKGVELTKKLAKDRVAPEQPLRVLFLLHPSQDAAKK